MSKYNIVELKEKKAEYRSLVSPQTLDELSESVLQILVMNKKYLDKDYSALKLARELGTNTRYISAVMGAKFHQNYTTFVNYYRIQDAKSILTDRRYLDLRMTSVSEMVGFANRQSFYAAFFRLEGITPRDYRMEYIAHHPDVLKAPAKRGRKKKEA